MKKLRYISTALFLMSLPLIVGATPPTTQGGNSLIGFQNPLNASTICQALKIFLDALMALAVPIAVVFLVYAGFLFVWARGNKDALVKAKHNILYTILGIAIFMGAWLLGQVVANTFNSLAVGAGQPNSQIGQCQ